MFCYKCGHEMPEDAKFCPKCGTPTPNADGTAQETQPKEAPKQQSKYKIDATKRVAITNDPYMNDPRFKAMTVYLLSQYIAAVVSTFIILGIYMSDGVALSIYYDSLDGNFLRTLDFLGPALIGSLICFGAAYAVSYIQLKKTFPTRAASAILIYGKLEVGALKFTNDEDDIELVDYFMKKYGQFARVTWILPVAITLLTAFIVPKII